MYTGTRTYICIELNKYTLFIIKHHHLHPVRTDLLLTFLFVKRELIVRSVTIILNLKPRTRIKKSAHWEATFL